MTEALKGGPAERVVNGDLQLACQGLLAPKSPKIAPRAPGRRELSAIAGHFDPLRPERGRSLPGTDIAARRCMTDRKCSIRPTLQRLVFGLALASAGFATSARADDDAPRPQRDDDDDSGHRSRKDNDRSKTHIAVDFDFDTALDAPGADAGGGGALRLGQKFDILLVSLTPEFGGGYHAFGGNDQTRLYSGFIGGRLGIGKIVEPSIFAHLGLAHAAGLENRTAPIMDAGLAVDLTLLPLIDLGFHAGYNAMFPRNDGSALKFLTLGAQAAIVL